MSSNLGDQLEKLPEHLGGHVAVCGAALLISLGISLPLALRVARSPTLRGPVVAVAGVIQTIPSLALLALMVPLLGAFGFWPALVALVLYGMLPILRNTVTGIANVQPELVEAAVGLGMTPRQVLTRVELPLALPVIVAGVRTSAVWLVGMATLATPVGQTSLGNYVFGGLQTRNWGAVLVGCASAALLAVAMDSLLALVERGVQKRHRPSWLGAIAGLAALFGIPLLVTASLRASHRPAATISTAGEPASVAPPAMAAVRVGSKTFTEQYILSTLIEHRLAAAGFHVERAQSLGSTIALDAITQNHIDVYVDYTGTLWANAMKRSEVLPSWHVHAEVSGFLAREYGVRVLGSLGFENAYVLAMPRGRADDLNIRTISDLVVHAPELRLGSDFELVARPEWRGLTETYGLSFAEVKSFESTFMYDAVKKGEVDVITAFSSDGRIDAYDLSVLADDRGVFPPYDAILLLSPRAAVDARVVAALEPLVGAIEVEQMRQANLMVDREAGKWTVADAARLLDPAR